MLTVKLAIILETNKIKLGPTEGTSVDMIFRIGLSEGTHLGFLLTLLETLKMSSLMFVKIITDVLSRILWNTWWEYAKFYHCGCICIPIWGV